MYNIEKMRYIKYYTPINSDGDDEGGECAESEDEAYTYAEENTYTDSSADGLYSDEESDDEW